MFRLKNKNLKKFTSFAIITTMLICSFTLNVNAIDADEYLSFDINDTAKVSMSGDADFRDASVAILSLDEKIAKIENDYVDNIAMKEQLIEKTILANQIQEIFRDDSLNKAQKKAAADMFAKEFNVNNITSKSSNDGMSVLVNQELNVLTDSTLIDDNSINNSIASMSYSPLPTNVNATYILTYFKQDNSYYCGPATAKQTLDWYNYGVSDSQATIASALGVTSSSGGVPNADTMRNYINNRITTSSRLNSKYIEVVSPSFDDFVWYLSNYYGPPILRMAGNTSNWRYSTGGHYMNVSGMYAYDCQLTDPYIQYISPSITSGKYYETYERVYAVTMAHFRQSFWW